MGLFDGLLNRFGGLWGQSWSRSGVSSPDSLLKSATTTKSVINRWIDWKSTYPAVEDYRRNTAIFLNVPYVYAGIIIRAYYSLGQEFKFVVPGTEEQTEEEQYLERLSYKLGLSDLFFKTAIHLDVYGNAYWYLYKDDYGEVRKIKLIQPERVAIKLDEFGNIEKYQVSYQDFSDKTQLPRIYEVDPENIVHFTERQFLEIPYGTSIIQPIADEAETRLKLGKILEVVYRRYAKPMVHFKYKPPWDRGISREMVKSELEAMQKYVEQMEPDSDIITSDEWDVTAISTPSIQNLTEYLGDLDQQIYAVLGVPEFFFKPKGTTDLNVSEAHTLWKKNMRNRQINFINQFMPKFVVPVLENKFPDSLVTPTLQFVEETDEKEVIDKVQKLLNMDLISKKEAKKMLGLGVDEYAEGESS